MEKIVNKLHSGDPHTVKDGQTILLRATVDRTGENLFLTFGSVVVKKIGVAGNFNRTRKRDYVPGLRRATVPVTYEELVENMDIDITKVLQLLGFTNVKDVIKDLANYLKIGQRNIMTRCLIYLSLI